MGRLAGWIMANRTSNRLRNAWTVDLLELAPGARSLEIGCGPGVGLQEILSRDPSVTALGMDHSPLMIATARSRNRAAAQAGRLELKEGTSPPDTGRLFDAIMMVNVAQFVPDRVALFRCLHGQLRPGGRIAVTFQPRGAQPTAEAGRERAEGFLRELRAAGEIHELPLRGVPAFCALARRPEAKQ